MKRVSFTSRLCGLASLLLLAGPLTAWGQTIAPPAPPAAPASPAPPVPCSGNADDYVVGLAEEFNTPLDPNVWLDRLSSTAVTPVMNYEVSNGSLKLWLQRDETDPQRNFVERIIYSNPSFITPTVPGAATPQSPPRTGYLQRYGCFEMEAKLPFGKGPWAAFWLAAQSGFPEFDIMEAYMRDQYADAQRHPISYEVAVHLACTPQDPECAPEGQKVVDSKLTYPNADLSAGFHRYAAKWEPNQVTFYLDGNVVHTTTISIAEPMSVRLSIFPDPRSLPDDTTPTRRGIAFDPGAVFEINYVRTWCFKNTGCR